jgi:hypothetical protein
MGRNQGDIGPHHRCQPRLPSRRVVRSPVLSCGARQSHHSAYSKAFRVIAFASCGAPSLLRQRCRIPVNAFPIHVQYCQPASCHLLLSTRFHLHRTRDLPRVRRLSGRATTVCAGQRVVDRSNWTSQSRLEGPGLRHGQESCGEVQRIARRSGLRGRRAVQHAARCAKAAALRPPERQAARSQLDCVGPTYDAVSRCPDATGYPRTGKYRRNTRIRTPFGADLT